MENFKQLIFSETTSVAEILFYFEKSLCKTAVIVNSDNKLKGVVSEGDLRRFIIRNDSMPDNLNKVINKHPKYIKSVKSSGEEIFMSDSLDQPIPIVDSDMKVVDIYYKNHVGSYLVMNHKKHFLVKTPSRISFAGGGSDVSSWFKENEGLVINAAINKFSNIYFKVTNNQCLRISSLNLGYRYTFELSEIGVITGKVPYKSEKDQFFLFQIFSKFKNLPGMDIEICCDFAPGSGLGGSSSIVTGLVKGITYILGDKLTAYKLASVSYETERYNCEINGGWQDHIASAFGGVCSLSFSKENFKVRRLSITEQSKNLLNSCLFLVKVGASRSSSDIHYSLSKNAKNTKQKMKKIVLNAKKVETTFTRENLNDLAELINEGWRLKKSLSPLISSHEVDQLINRVIDFGATGARLLGAGKSGYVLIYVPPENLLIFFQKCNVAGIQANSLNIVERGSTVIEI